MKLDMVLLNELFTQMLKLFRMMGKPSPTPQDFSMKNLRNTLSTKGHYGIYS